MLSRLLLSSSKISSRALAPASSISSLRLFSTEASSTSATPSATPAPPAAAAPSEVEDSVNVPKQFVRFIIGTKGVNAMKLSEESGGAKIKFQKEDTPDGKSEIGRIFGTAQQVSEMKRLILEDLQKFEKEPPMASNNKQQQQQDGYAEDIVVDAQYVGFLIGKAGAVLKEMEASSGARIRYSDQDFSAKDRTARVTGTFEQVQACKKMIADKLFERQNEPAGSFRAQRPGQQRYQDSDVKQVVEVPSDIVGALIGKGGLALHRMQDDTGAKFEFAKEESRRGVKEVTIYGTEHAIQNACDLLQSRVQEINSRNHSRG